MKESCGVAIDDGCVDATPLFKVLIVGAIGVVVEEASGIASLPLWSCSLAEQHFLTKIVFELLWTFSYNVMI